MHSNYFIQVVCCIFIFWPVTLFIRRMRKLYMFYQYLSHLCQKRWCVGFLLSSSPICPMSNLSDVNSDYRGLSERPKNNSIRLWHKSKLILKCYTDFLFTYCTFSDDFWVLIKSFWQPLYFIVHRKDTSGK